MCLPAFLYKKNKNFPISPDNTKKLKENLAALVVGVTTKTPEYIANATASVTFRPWGHPAWPRVVGAEGDVQTFCSRAGLRGVGTPLNELVPMPLMALASFPLLRH